MQPEFNNQQSDWLNQAEELNDYDAVQVNGGSSLVDQSNALYQSLLGQQIAFQQQTAGAKAAKDQSGKAQN
ncbi:MAG: hypothetical protein AAGA16_19020 [Cyanobacteria bacterium P01_E01_bin.35]